MHRPATHRRSAWFAGLVGLAATAVAATSGDAQTPPVKSQRAPAQAAAAKTQPAPAKAEAPAAKSSQAIVVLVNDEPVTAYEIEQRARFLALSANIGDRVKDAFKRLVESESTNQKVRAILDEVIAANPGKTREQILAIFEERKKQFGMNLQRQAMESARAAMLPQYRKEAQEELIEDRLRFQEAKRVGVEITDDDIKRIMTSLAERNKMTEAQFADHLRGMGVDPRTLRERFRAHQGWREAIRRRYAAQIAISQRDVDRIVSAAATEAGEELVELQVQRITLALPGSMTQAALARRYSEAEALRRKFNGCAGMANLAKEGGDVRYEDLKFIKPSAVAEPTRSMLLYAKDGELLPPTTAAAGIEIYAVCNRRTLKGDDKQRAKATDELQQQEFEILAKRHLRDLKQDAHIEYR